MSFQPVVPLSGYAGWRFLQRTLPAQQAAFANSAPEKRATDYFREKIGAVQSAEDLVSDRRLLSVALNAFGLGDDINNKAFVRKILEDGSLTPEALGNRLADKRYLAFSKAFGFGDFSTPRTVLSDFPDEILSKYQRQAFETAVGQQDDTMRLALNLRSGLADTIAGNSTNDGRWFGIMGNPPLREVVQTALGFSSSFAQLDLDQQLEQFKDRADNMLGTSIVEDFSAPEIQDKLIRNFLIRSEAAASANTSAGMVALSLLQMTPSPYST